MDEMVDSATGSSFNDEFRGFPTAILRKADRIRHLDFSLSLSLSLTESFCQFGEISRHLRRVMSSAPSSKASPRHGPWRLSNRRRLVTLALSPRRLGGVRLGFLFFPFFFQPTIRSITSARRLADEAVNRAAHCAPIAACSTFRPPKRREGHAAAAAVVVVGHCPLSIFFVVVVVVVVVVFPSSPA